MIFYLFSDVVPLRYDAIDYFFQIATYTFLGKIGQHLFRYLY